VRPSEERNPPRAKMRILGLYHFVTPIFGISRGTSNSALRLFRIQGFSLFQRVELRALRYKGMHPNDRSRIGARTTKINSRSSSEGTKKNITSDGASETTPLSVTRASPRYDSPTSRGLTPIDNTTHSLRDDLSSSSSRALTGPKITQNASPSQPNHPNPAPVISPSTPPSTNVPGTRISTTLVNAGMSKAASLFPGGITTPNALLPTTRARPGVAPYTQRPSPSSQVDPLLQKLCCRCGTACVHGTDCACAEELCQCHAYQIIHSLSRSAAVASCVRGGGGDALASISNGNHRPSVFQLELSVGGMTCSMCGQAVEKALRKALPPDNNHIAHLDVSLTTDTVTMEWSVLRKDDKQSNYDEEVIRQYGQTFRNAVEGIGYTVQNIQIQRVQKDEISPERRDLPMGNAEDLPSSAVGATVEDRWQLYRQRQTEKVESRRNAFLWASAMTLPLMALTMVVPYFAPNLFHDKHIILPFLPNRSFELESLILWALATPVQFICGWEFYRMAWYGFWTGRAGMDLLVALGTTASYLYACYGVWTGDVHGAHFFETSAVLIAFVLAGKWMQAAAVRRTSDAITQLMQLQSPSAILVKPQNPDATKLSVWNPLVDPYVEEIVPIQEVKVGDMVKVIRGAAIPVDGIVLYGDISVDESMMTGESSPVLKTNGSFVLGGTVCVESSLEEESKENANRVGAAFVQVTGVGSSSALAKIVQLVEQAQTRAVPIQSFADQVSAVFVPTVCAISLGTFIVWYVKPDEFIVLGIGLSHCDPSLSLSLSGMRCALRM
jgi:copper chaperone CopZ